MRYYLLFDSDANTIKTITDSFNTIGDFKCSGIIKSNEFKLHQILKFPPELIIMNIDKFTPHSYSIVEKINKAVGIPPDYIGITSSPTKGFEAFKNGFIDIIDKNKLSEIYKVLSHYRATRYPNKFYCLSYYTDFHYLIINDIAFLKADNYTTEFVMGDGSHFTNFMTLKLSHQQLPINFQRIHNSFVINSHYVRRIHSGKWEVYLRNFKDPIPLSKSFLKNINEVKKQLTDTNNPTLK